MKKLLAITSACIIISLFLASCGSNLTIAKRHYRKGFYVEFAKNTHSPNPVNNVERKALPPKRALQSICRTTEIRSDFLSSAIGLGRSTIDWEEIKNVKVPFLPLDDRKDIASEILRAWETEKKSERVIQGINGFLHEKFDVESEDSQIRFLGAKPPK